MTLGKRQLQVLKLTSLGYQDKTIADNLRITERAIQHYWPFIHKHIGSKNRCQAGYIFALNEKEIKVNKVGRPPRK